MENKNVNPVNQSDDLSQMKAMFANYQQKQSKTARKSKEDILAKYFVPRKTNEIFRILPVKPGKKLIEEAFFHVAPMNIAGGKKKHGSIVYCPAHNDPKIPKLDSSGQSILDSNGQPIMIPAPCPLCAKYKKLIAKQDPSIKYVKKENLDESQKKIKAKNDEIYKDATVWEAKKFYIIRGVDKGAEKDGVKFWRFKHNFKNQGTLDKLLPILNGYIGAFNADPTSPVNGTDLNITMTDSEFNGRAYKSISAIMFKGSSALNADSIIAKSWLDDPITWRDVFKAKNAPCITPYEMLEMISSGNNPYWDDSDASNKHWVFPGHPALEEQANTRNRNLDGNSEDTNFEYASDLDEDEGYRVNINNVSEHNVGQYKDNAVDLGAQIISNSALTPSNTVESSNLNEDSNNQDYDDLPF